MKKIFSFLKNLLRNLRGLAIKFVTPSVEIVEGIKKAVESPVTDLLTAVIPGTWDNFLVARARQTLPRVLQILRISDECLKLVAADEIIKCAIDKLKLYDPDGQKASYHSIAAMLSMYLSDHKLSWREALHLAEEVYQQRKEAKNA